MANDRSEWTRERLALVYRDLGLYLYADDVRATEFPDLYRHLKRLYASRSSVAAITPAPPTHAVSENKTIQMADHQKALLHLQSLEQRINQVLEELGDAVFRKHGEGAGPPELIQRIIEGRATITAREIEINERAKSAGSDFFTPRRLLFGGIAAILLISLMVFARFLNH